MLHTMYPSRQQTTFREETPWPRRFRGPSQNTIHISPSQEPTFPHSHTTQRCLKFKELFFLSGDETSFILQWNLSPQRQCPLSNYVLSLSFQRIPRHLQSPRCQKEPTSSPRNLFPFLAHLLPHKIFFPKICPFKHSSCAHSQTQINCNNLVHPLYTNLKVESRSRWAPIQ